MKKLLLIVFALVAVAPQMVVAYYTCFNTPCAQHSDAGNECKDDSWNPYKCGTGSYASVRYACMCGPRGS